MQLRSADNNQHFVSLEQNWVWMLKTIQQHTSKIKLLIKKLKGNES